MGYDYSHYKIHGLDMRRTMRQLVGRSVFIHVKDSVGTEQNYRFLLPGDSGEIDYKEYAEILRESYWAQDSSLESVLALAQRAGASLADDADVAEFVWLVSQANRLAEGG